MYNTCLFFLNHLIVGCKKHASYTVQTWLEYCTPGTLVPSKSLTFEGLYCVPAPFGDATFDHQDRVSGFSIVFSNLSLIANKHLIRKHFEAIKYLTQQTLTLDLTFMDDSCLNQHFL